MFDTYVKNLNTREFKLAFRALAEHYLGEFTNPEIKRLGFKKKLFSSESELTDYVLSGKKWKLTVSLCNGYDPMSASYPDGWIMSVYPPNIEGSSTPYRPTIFKRGVAMVYVSDYDAWLRDMSLIFMFDKPSVANYTQFNHTEQNGSIKVPPMEYQ